jgi:hypothetical protein
VEILSKLLKRNLQNPEKTGLNTQKHKALDLRLREWLRRSRFCSIISHHEFISGSVLINNLLIIYVGTRGLNCAFWEWRPKIYLDLDIIISPHITPPKLWSTTSRALHALMV